MIGYSHVLLIFLIASSSIVHAWICPVPPEMNFPNLFTQGYYDADHLQRVELYIKGKGCESNNSVGTHFKLGNVFWRPGFEKDEIRVTGNADSTSCLGFVVMRTYKNKEYLVAYLEGEIPQQDKVNEFINGTIFTEHRDYEDNCLANTQTWNDSYCDGICFKRTETFPELQRQGMFDLNMIKTVWIRQRLGLCEFVESYDFYYLIHRVAFRKKFPSGEIRFTQFIDRTACPGQNLYQMTNGEFVEVIDISELPVQLIESVLEAQLHKNILN
uniref:Uncharacterized protein n=1 Tax=Rhabditophanes sp. KR3021 TaxID=114890 RepID=A0AC35UB48_9BILA